jgi:hypothetical protein
MLASADRMKFVLALLVAFPAFASNHEKEVERALIERDRQSAEFANRSLEGFHARQLTEPGRPDERARQAREREAEALRSPPGRSGSDPEFGPDYRPLPLPGGPVHGVDPIPAQGASRG